MTRHFITKSDVPLLDEHTLKDEDGNEILKVDRRKLEEIARKNNERIAQTGDYTPYVVGHTREDAPEDEQPQIVGYATHFTVKPLKKTGRYAIHAHSKFFADKKHLVNRFPRRSVELWLDDWKIDPIALLGATTPERDLGLLQLARGGRRKLRRVFNPNPGPVRYQMPFPPAQTPSGPPAPAQPTTQDMQQGAGDPQAAAVAQAVVAMLEDTAEWQWIRQQIEASQAAPPPAGDPMAGMDDMLPPVASDQALDPMMGDEFGGGDEDAEYDDEDDEDEDEEDEEEDDPVRYSASYASGTNTFTPGTSSNRPMTTYSRPPAGRPARPQAPADLSGLAYRLKAAADARRLQYARQQRAMHYMASELQSLRLRYQRAEREKDLIQLEAEGVLLDRVEELDAVVGMPQKQYESYLGRLRKRYSRAPVGRMAFSAEDYRSAGPGAGCDRESSQSIAERALERGISYEAALREAEGR